MLTGPWPMSEAVGRSPLGHTLVLKQACFAPSFRGKGRLGFRLGHGLGLIISEEDRYQKKRSVSGPTFKFAFSWILLN